MVPPTVSSIELATIEAVLDMGGGYVLGFSDRTFSHFFADLGFDIDALAPDGSKAKRLRKFLRTEAPPLVATALQALLDHRGSREDDPAAHQIPKYQAIVARLRGVTVASVGSVVTEVLTLGYVHELEAKTDQRLTGSDLEGAITAARTMVEAVLRELQRQLVGSDNDHGGDLQRLFKAVAKAMRIDDDRTDIDDNFKQVARGLVQVVNGLTGIRNKMSDGHARERKPVAHHARMIVNAAKTVATFLVESYLFQREKGTLPPSARR